MSLLPGVLCPLQLDNTGWTRTKFPECFINYSILPFLNNNSKKLFLAPLFIVSSLFLWLSWILCPEKQGNNITDATQKPRRKHVLDLWTISSYISLAYWKAYYLDGLSQWFHYTCSSFEGRGLCMCLGGQVNASAILASWERVALLSTFCFT